MNDTTAGQRGLVPATTRAEAILPQSSLGSGDIYKIKGWQKYAPAVAEMAAILELLTEDAKKRREGETTFFDSNTLGYNSSKYGSDWSHSLHELVSRLQRVFKSQPQLPSLVAGRTEKYEEAYLFNHLSIIFGFFNFLPAYGESKALDGRTMSVSSEIFSRRVHESAAISISSSEWGMLRDAAAGRLWLRLQYQCQWRLSNQTKPKGYDPYWEEKQKQELDKFDTQNHVFTYYGGLDKNDISSRTSPLVTRIVSSEEQRLRKIVDALDGTLRVLAEVAAMRKEMPPPVDMTALIGTLHAVLSGKAEAEVLLSPPPIITEETVSDEQESASLSAPQSHDASIAAFLDYLEALYESLENSLEELERLEQSYENMDSMERFRRSKPTELLSIRTQYEGTYGWGVEYFFNAVGSLMELLYATMRKGSQEKHEAGFLTEHQCLYMFIGIATHAGFAVSFLVNFSDLTGYFRDNKDFTAVDSSTRLIDFTRPLRKENWDTLRSQAIKRIPYLLQDKYNISQQNLLAIFRWGNPYFSHPGLFGSGETNKGVSGIITKEVIRFRRFLEAFHGTLQFLADVKPLAQTKIKPPVFDWDKRKEALGIFQQTIDLLRTVATGGTVSIPQTQIVEGSLAQNQPLAQSQPEELFRVEIEDVGVVIALGKRDAALVVFAPAKYKRKKVTVTTARGLEIVAYLAQQIDEDFFAAIFPRIPLQDGITETVEVACDKLRGKATLIACNPIKVFLEEELHGLPG